MKELIEKIKNEGKILPGDILKIDHFLNHQIDINILNKIGEEFYNIFKEYKIDKIITIEASGIAIATVVAQRFNVPFVFAKEDKSSNISNDVYTSKVHSYTHEKDYNIIISKEYLHENENVLLIDDFLAKGSACSGLIDICEQAHANIVGIGICVEKVYQSGGEKIKEKNYNLVSLARILSLSYEDGIVIEE